jgi:hypothetical protein
MGQPRMPICWRADLAGQTATAVSQQNKLHQTKSVRGTQGHLATRIVDVSLVYRDGIVWTASQALTLGIW